jgi:hypothetical protein
MDDTYTHVSFVLDNSGSMAPVSKDTIEAFNKFLTDQKALPGKMTFSLYGFKMPSSWSTDNGVTPVLPKGVLVQSLFKDIQSIEPLNDKTYVCTTDTPLLDAVGYAIDSTGSSLGALDESQRPAKVLVVILTDGYENASNVYKKDIVKSKIEHQTGLYHWQFTFLGANIDAIAEAASMGIARGATLNFASASIGATMGIVSQQTTNYRSRTNGAGYAYTDTDREKAVGDE